MKNGLHSDSGASESRLPSLGKVDSQDITLSTKPMRKGKLERGKRLIEDPGYPDKQIADALADMLMSILQ